MNLTKEKRLFIFFFISFLESMAANFAHPITPTIIKNLNLNSYMFGVAFAAMSFTNFLFSPFWGKISNYFSYKKLLGIGCIGYGVGQILFGISKTELSIVAARCFSGFFVGAISVISLIFLVDFSPNEKLAKELTIFATIQSVGAAFGYFVGGIAGVWSITGTFILQAFTLFLCGALFYFLLESNKRVVYDKIQARKLITEANPFLTFLESRKFMTKAIAVLFLAVLFTNVGTYSFDQCFNYYIKDQFGFSPAYNGILKAVIGILTLAVNSTVCMWIIRKTNVKRSIGIVLVSCIASITGILVTDNLSFFITMCLILFAFTAVCIPLLQDCVAKDADSKNTNIVMGFYNAIQSLGMIGGSLIAGLIYSYHAKLPFGFSGFCFILAVVLLAANQFMKKGVQKS